MQYKFQVLSFVQIQMLEYSFVTLPGSDNK